jgi:hypothetical protein
MRTLCLVLACASFAWAANTTKPAESKSATTQHATAQQRWAPEVLKGTVSMVDPKQDLVVVRDSSGVPFDFRIQQSTHIENGQSPVKLSDLAKNESVNVRFVPEARGDIARQIQVQK